MGRDIRYQMSLHDPYGKLLYEFVDILNLDYARADKQVGSLTVYLPYTYVDALGPVLPRLHNPQSFAKHSQLRLWRTVDGGNVSPTVVGSTGQGITTLEPQTVWLILKPARVVTLNGERFIKLQAYDWLWVLTTRMVGYPAGEPQSEKDLIDAETVLGQWFTENLGTGAPAGRDLVGPGYLGLEPFPAGGPVVSQESAWEPVFTAMVETAEKSEQKGQWMSFDFVSIPYPDWHMPGVSYRQTGDFPWLLRMRYEWLGKDRRPGSAELANDECPVVLSVNSGHLYDVEFFDDYSQEFTGVYGLGKGTGNGRQIAYVDDSARQAGTPFGRVETIEQARDAEDISAVQDAAATKLELSNPWRQIVADYEDSWDIVYGRDFFYHDVVAVEDHEVRFPVRVNGVQVSVEDGVEEKKLAFERIETPS